MQYKSASFRSSDRSNVRDTSSSYTIELDREIDQVKEIRLGTIELPRTQYIVEENRDRNGKVLPYNTLNFAEGYKLGLNGIQYTDPSTGAVTNIHVPNYLSALDTVNDGGDYWQLITYLPWDATKYFTWKEAREALGDVVPDLLLLGADTGDPHNPLVVLTKDNFTQDAADPSKKTFRLAKTAASFAAVASLHLHRAPWHVPELLDFINYCIGSQVMTMTADGQFKINNYLNTATPAFQFILDDDPDMLYADGLASAMPDLTELPFTISGDKSTSGKVAPKMTATLPVGDYTAGDIAKLLPQFMSLGHLKIDATFGIMIGLQMFSVTVPAGTYSTPFLFNEAIRLAMETTFAGNPVAVSCEYAGVSAQAIFNTTQYPLGKFRFFGIDNATGLGKPFVFMLDFSHSSLELVNALKVDAIQYGPATSIDSNDNITWPNFLGIVFNNYNYEMSSTVPATQKYCIKAFNPDHVNFQGKADMVGCTMFLTDMTRILPYQTNDVCFFQRTDASAWLSTARVMGAGYVFKMIVLNNGAYDICQGDVVIQTMGNGREVAGMVHTIDTGTGEIEVYSLFSIDNDHFEPDLPIENVFTGLSHDISFCTNCKKLGLVLQVGCHLPTISLETMQLKTGFIDCPRFEVENFTTSLSPRLGIPSITDYPASVGEAYQIPRLSGSNFYLFPNQFNLDPLPYMLVFVMPAGAMAADQYHKHQGVSDPPLAKLVMQTPFTITRNQIMELRGNFGTVKQLRIEFRNPDGSFVNFHGREHSMTIGFVCGQSK